MVVRYLQKSMWKFEGIFYFWHLDWEESWLAWPHSWQVYVIITNRASPISRFYLSQSEVALHQAFHYGAHQHMLNSDDTWEATFFCETFLIKLMSSCKSCRLRLRSTGRAVRPNWSRKNCIYASLSPTCSSRSQLRTQGIVQRRI